MIRNKMFSLFYIKTFIMLLFLSNVPFLLFADTNDDKRYTYKSDDYQSREYKIKDNYLGLCKGDASNVADWTNYPDSNIRDIELSSYPTCLKKRYCSDLDEKGNLFITTPGYDENGKETLNCYRKSCLDLELKELKAIYNNQKKLNGNFYKFCEPVKYTNYNNIPMAVGGFSNREPVYCNEFKKGELQYLIPDIWGRTGIDGKPVYQCLLHQCPLSNDVSALCKTNFWMFSDKSDNNQRIRSDDYISEYEKRILGNANVGINKRYNLCTQLNTQQLSTQGKENYCQKNRSSRLLPCDGELNTSCDEYIGFDRTFGKEYNNLRNSFISYNGTKQTCSEGNTCRQTIDCKSEKNASDYSCKTYVGSAGSSDVFLSYFYRPYPHPATTEILNVDKSLLSNSNDLSSKIYGKDFDNLEKSGSTKITAIKRLMRGGEPRPLPSDGSVIETRNETNLVLHLDLLSNHMKNYFQYIINGTINDTDRLNICMSSKDDFRKYGFRKVSVSGDSSNVQWYEGEYYKKDIGSSNNFFEIFNAPHLIPLCNATTTYSSYGSLGALCGVIINESNSECSTPRSDSYYIKGKPEFKYKTDRPELEEVRVNACLRKRNEYGSCGARECRVSTTNCDTGDCSGLEQTCSEDKCVELIWKDGLNCKLSNNEDNECIKKITGSNARFRLQKINNKMYVFIDDNSGMALNGVTGNRWFNCPEGSDMKKIKSNSDSNKVEITYLDTYQKGGKNASIITYRGRITDANLLDSNDLIDYNRDGIIDDKDVFGEELYDIFKCGNKEKRNKEKCDSMSTKNKEDGTHNWITWDIVQYIGNNQPTEGNPSCNVGSLKNCRGYYDAEGKFHKEQQGIPIPLPASPKFFYKYATLNNSSNMFLPLLRIISARSYDDVTVVDIKNTEDDNNIRLNFFEPRVLVGFGHTQALSTIPFADIEITKEIEETTRKISIEYKLKKTVDGIMEPTPNVCLSRIIKKGEGQKEDIEEVVKCLKRKNPTIDSIIIKTPQEFTQEEGPYMNASFIKKELVNKTDNSPITLNDNNSIKFLSGTLESREKLKPNTYAKAQEYPVYIKKSNCSTLQYECMAYRSDLINKKNELDNLEKETNEINKSILESQIANLNSKINYCEDNIQKECDKLNDGFYLVSLTNNSYNSLSTLTKARLCRLYQNNENEYSEYKSSCTDEINTFIDKENKKIKYITPLEANVGVNKEKMPKSEEGFWVYSVINVPKNYNLIGQTNDICISTGFDEYFPNVVAYQSVNDTLGKCVLTAESKAKKECRREEYYSLCTNNTDDSCICMNGSSNCNCSDGVSCIKKVICGEGTELPDECFLPGFNYYETVLKGDGSPDISCKCELATSDIAETGKEIRKATPRELGLCANLKNVQICQAVKYYDKNKVYHDGGAGEKLDVIKNNYKSHIWRTEQNKFGENRMPDLEHAEFDLSKISDNKDGYRLLQNYCYNSETGDYFLGTNCKNNSNYKSVLATVGECRGFWKNKTIKISSSSGSQTKIIKPLGACMGGDFRLYQNTGCERYSCPEINEGYLNYATDNEKSQINSSEIDYLTANRKGLSHGFANWGSYKKGTYDITSKTIRDDEVENGHGDDIEQRTAESCIQGYAPAGFGKILYKYFPVAFNSDGEVSDKFGNDKKDNFIKNMLINNEDFVSKNSMLQTLFSGSQFYDARKHLPVRYCNQIGQWMPVEDIYTRFKIKPYGINNPIFHEGLTDFGYVDVGSNKERDVAIKEENTYGINVDYSQKYCERLFCRSFGYNDILQSIDNEEKDINKEEVKNLKEYTLHTSIEYPSIEYGINYFNGDEVNKFTYWRHTGGATWNETPAPLKDESIEITGNCSSLAGYFPKDAEFLSEIKEEIAEDSGNPFKTRYSSFAKQHSDLFSNFSGGERNPRVFDFVSNRQSATKPTRQCDKWGIWGEIENKCKKACEPIDPFRTKFSFDGISGKIQIDALYKIPHLRKKEEENYFYEENGDKYGDKYTGGAQWGRTLAGEYAIGECDSTISKDIYVIDEDGHKIPSSKNIVFIRSGPSVVKINGEDVVTGGRPYRECLSDGTWGKIENPCILYEACSEKTIANYDLANNNIEEKQIVGILNSSSLTIDKIRMTTKEGKTEEEKIVEVKSLCDSRYYTGEITGQCSLGSKEWEGNITSTCELKTCSGFTKALGKNGSIPFFNVSNNQYFAKGSGFKNNKLSMKNKSYLGYKTKKQCPSYFTCKDCENNTVSYTCDYNKMENKLEWTADGSCEPISCSVENLEKVCNGKDGCELSNELEEPNDSFITKTDKDFMDITKDIVFEESSSKYDETNRRYAIGSVIKLNEGIKYKYKGGNEVYAICESNGFWRIQGGFESLKCADSDLSTVDNATWIATNIGICEDKSKSDGLSCPGTEKLLQCNDGYERAPNAEKLSTQCLYVNGGKEVSWSNVNLNKEIASQYCIKKSNI